MDAEFLQQLQELITVWGIVGVCIAPFAGPVFIQRTKYLIPSLLVGKRKTKRRKATLALLSALITGLASYWALSQQYQNTSAVILVAILVMVFQTTIIELVFLYADKKNPEVSRILSEGIWLPESEQTVFTKLGSTVLGGGVDKRNVPR